MKEFNQFPVEERSELKAAAPTHDDINDFVKVHKGQPVAYHTYITSANNILSDNLLSLKDQSHAAQKTFNLYYGK